MGTELDIDDVCADWPKAKAELERLRGIEQRAKAWLDALVPNARKARRGIDRKVMDTIISEVRHVLGEGGGS